MANCHRLFYFVQRIPRFDTSYRYYITSHHTTKGVVHVAQGGKRRQVWFNLDNADEREMYEFTRRVNFSKLVKRYLAIELRKPINRRDTHA